MTMSPFTRRAGLPAALLALCAAAPSVVAPAPAAAAPAATPALVRLAHARPAARADVIVQVRPGVGLASARTLVRRAGGRVTTRAVPIIHAFGARLGAAAALRVARRPSIRAVSLNGRVRTRASIPTG